MEYNVLRADPAGNITLFVFDPVETARRPALAARLMGMSELAAEQVGFVCPAREGGDGRFEMMGGEFCGNATRAFGMYLARAKGMTGKNRLLVETSGCDRAVAVETDADAGTSEAEMPLPQLVRRVARGDVRGTLVHLGGIAHLVVEGVAPGEAYFRRAEPLFAELPGLDAYGVIFLADGAMTPLVKVRATGTLVWEGSCGSGTLAAAVAQSEGADGAFARDYVQPAGTVRASVTRRGGRVVRAAIGGRVTLGEMLRIET